ncbi:hypothetical protein HRR83_005921 [Exophiala dermatitidis]|uniref:S-adenosyl-L-methionine-dependent methyltransferase n=2 Tax=Exophiala dermatitidis TaxID=5970 RepID=H6BNP7_EXODN|nr:uncharacterized protein HMPREF1120_01429 [Exophiala dermatitidis NIH/UT8656]KAJ4505101.1 hypothetical protein HRR75_007436 [Exophiala dermatitidis]EHY53232.1 hypothetical protein HMPREF1120_01429 [Exophiala dermatitidis NIH/UT8656]KAJ4507182.1 hypothetical protein HRR74_008105 [Exophiala dermatitidis]KAJ4517344.1 hypothetical protein HRR73_004396 [Exophiala dermatitidis]KAJ4550683.1 hypothetical protein HRR78_004452 [Exophiala dermatitidis]
MPSPSPPRSPAMQPDPNVEEEDDPGYDSASDQTATTSLNSSIFDWVYENGRRYHSYRPTQYVLPNDEEEQERLDLTHHLFTLVLHGAYCLTPLENPQAILDVGTGTGIWAIDMGDLYPSAVVTGTDLSPIQSQWVPPNVRFEVDDANEEWTFPESHFDFIHARTICAGIRDFPKFLASCYKHLKPGGKIEVSEGRANFFCDDNTLPADSFTKKYLDELHRCASLINLDMDHIPKVPGELEQAGFTNVNFVQRHVPLGTWPKDKSLKIIGKIFREQFVNSALEAYSLKLLCEVGGWSLDEFRVLCANVRREIAENKMHLYTFCSFATAEKPLT